MSSTPVHLTDAAKPSLIRTPVSGSATPDTAVYRVKNVPGYTTPAFAGKKAQLAKVVENVASKGFIPKELVKNEVEWFYNTLGIEDTYFSNEDVEVVSDHVIALYGAKVGPRLSLFASDPAVTHV